MSTQSAKTKRTITDILQNLETPKVLIVDDTIFNINVFKVIL